MAIDGVYNVTVKTPMGDQKMKLTLKTDGDKLTGFTENPMTGKAELSGKVSGNQIEFTTNAKTPMGLMKFDIKATIDGDTFKGTSNSPFGPAAMEGKRM